MVQNSPFKRFGVFEPVFTSGRNGASGPGWYLVLINLNSDGAAAVRVVSECLGRSRSPRTDIAALLLTGEGWRPQLVGCVALLMAPQSDRPLDELIRAIRNGSWVAPQLLVTAAITCPSGWETQVAPDLVKRGDTKAAAALAAVTAATLPELEVLASSDDQGGADIARDWPASLSTAFDEAGLERSWEPPIHPSPAP